MSEDDFVSVVEMAQSLRGIRRWRGRARVPLAATSGVVLLGALFLAALFLAAGCAPQLDRIEVSLQENLDELSAMRAESRRLSQEVAALTELIRRENSMGFETDAQGQARLGQLAVRIDQLVQLLQDNAEYMRQLSARVDLLATRSGVATLGVYKPPPANAADGLSEEGRSIYQAAELDRDRGNHELASTGYQEFLDKYPESELADDALYWLGVLHQENRNCEEALSQFGVLLSRFPESERAPAALLKSAHCLEEMGEAEEARKKRSELLSKYPQSDEAALVRAESEGG